MENDKYEADRKILDIKLNDAFQKRSLLNCTHENERFLNGTRFHNKYF